MTKKRAVIVTSAERAALRRERAEEISAIVTRALAFGVDVPKQLRPLIKALHRLKNDPVRR